MIPPVRPARADELAILPAVEDSTEATFRAAGLVLPPSPHPTTVAVLAAAAAVFVAGEPPIGFAQLEIIDGQAHLAELSVRPEDQGSGVGSALIEASCAWASEHGFAEITLTTFRDVTFNGPFYARRGFAELPEPGPELAAIRARERTAGLDAASPRIAMRRALRAA